MVTGHLDMLKIFFLYLLTSMIGEGTNAQRIIIISNGGGDGLVFNWIFIKYVSDSLSPD